ncbi:putative mitochondrial protein [Tanacetum coccineum]
MENKSLTMIQVKLRMDGYIELSVILKIKAFHNKQSVWSVRLCLDIVRVRSSGCGASQDPKSLAHVMDLAISIENNQQFEGVTRTGVVSTAQSYIPFTTIQSGSLSRPGQFKRQTEEKEQDVSHVHLDMVEVSLNSVIEFTSPRTMKIHASIGGLDVVVLIDCELGSTNVILGITWLQNLSETSNNWKKLTMPFDHDEFEDVFSLPQGLPPHRGHEHSIILKDSNEPISWSEKVTTAFQALKENMKKVHVLALPDFIKAFIIEINASGQGVGGVLMQEGRPSLLQIDS